MSETLLEVDGLSVRFAGRNGAVTPVKEVSFAVEPGEMVGLVGESGSGKTLTAMAIAGLAPATATVSARSLRLGDVDVLRAPSATVRGRLGTQLGMVFQNPMSSFNPALRIGTQVAEPARVHKGLARKAALQVAGERLAAAHVPNPELRLRQYPHELSGGLRQRAMIAMGLMNEPALIIADEPTTALDVTTQAQILDLLSELNRERGTAVLLISHDLDVIADVCSRTLVMYAGRIVEDAPTGELMSRPAHPYAAALMAARPRLDADRSERLHTIPGRPPLPSSRHEGCPFAPRCAVALERCGHQRPQLEVVGTARRAACWMAFEDMGR